MIFERFVYTRIILIILTDCLELVGIIAYYVYTMRLDSITKTVNGKTYTSHLLRQAYRDNGKVRHRTIANLSSCTDEEIQAIRLALQHKGDLQTLASVRDDLNIQQGLSIGALFTVFTVAKRLGIVQALGNSQPAKQALWQIIARVLDQGSRLSAVRLASTHAACDVLGLKPFDEDDLYLNLDWLCDQQASIEDRLFRFKRSQNTSQLFLYDVTSSYLEGTDNHFSAFGYNRDGKKSKRQIVIGLLCDRDGYPLSIEVFAGNTSDTATFASQIRKVADRFGGGEVTLVGDRGMIKGPQIKAIQNEKGGLHFITAITKPQIESLLKSGVIQLELFDESLAEVTDTAQCVRYVLRRNPRRAEELAAARQDKCRSIEAVLEKQNKYLSEHPRARVEAAVGRVNAKIAKLRLTTWLSVSSENRVLSLTRDEEALNELAKLDGCYCLKTDLTAEVADKELVHERYKSLSQVEWAFRTCKTSHLELRPVYVRKEARTRGHALVVMLAYRIEMELRQCWAALDMTVAEGLAELSSLCMLEVTITGMATVNQVPTPRASIQSLLDSADIKIPEALPYTGAKVYTKKKLTEERKPVPA